MPTALRSPLPRPLGTRDAAAHDLTNAFDFNQNTTGTKETPALPRTGHLQTDKRVPGLILMIAIALLAIGGGTMLRFRINKRPV